MTAHRGGGGFPARAIIAGLAVADPFSEPNQSPFTKCTLYRVAPFFLSDPRIASPLASRGEWGYKNLTVKVRRYDEIKQREAQSRSMVMGSKGTRSAARQQRRVSLAGNGAKWRITNWQRVARAMAKWA